MDTIHNLPAGLAINAPVTPEYAQILTPEALAFFATLARKFEPTRQSLLAARAVRQKQFDAGTLPDFLAETKHIREGSWVVAPCPADIQDRRIEITGPTDRKMVINALNCGARADHAAASSWQPIRVRFLLPKIDRCSTTHMIAAMMTSAMKVLGMPKLRPAAMNSRSGKLWPKPKPAVESPV